MTSIDATGSTAAAQAASLIDSIGNAPAALTPEAVLMLLERRLDDTDQQIEGVMQEIETNTARSQAIQRRVEGLQKLKTAMANKQGDSDEPVSLSEVTVEWNGEPITGVELLNELGITDLSTEDGVPVDPEGVSDTEWAAKEDRLAEIEAQLEEAGMPYYHRLRERLEGTTRKRTRIRLGRRIHRAKRRIERKEGIDIDPLLTERAELMTQLESRGETGSEGYPEDVKVTGAALESYIQQLQSKARRANSGNEMLMIQMRSAMSQREQSVTMAKSMMDTLNRSLNKLAQW